MSHITKYSPINGANLVSDYKSSFFASFRSKKTVVLAYASVFFFIAFTIFFAFSPSVNSSTPWYTSVFNLGTGKSSSSSTTSSSSSVFSDESYRSHFSSIYSYLFPNSSSTSSPQSHNAGSPDFDKGSPVLQNKTDHEDATHKVEDLKQNNSSILPHELFWNQTVNNATVPPKLSDSPAKGSSDLKNQTQNEPLSSKAEVLRGNQSTSEVSANSSSASVVVSNSTADGEKNIAEKSAVKNLTSSLMKKPSNNGTNNSDKKQGIDDLIKSLMNCDFFDGNWVRDESYPLYKPGSCSLIDEQFNCFLNGRPDNDYYKLKWKPKGCTLPRLNGNHMLELLKGKRLVFVGDSLNRNMWESLICILRNSVKDQSKVYEEFGRHHFRAEASYSFIFEDYKFSVEFFASPFLVREWEVSDKNGAKKETLRLDLIGQSADKYKHADILVFNTGHWWTHDKTSKGKDYYQEGSHVYSELNVLEAFRRALTTWGKWVDNNINPKKSLVFFRGYSASHFSGGQWNSGGQCDHETEPIKNETYLSDYPPKMSVLEGVFKEMRTSVSYLNVTRMTDYRKDGHPSIYRKQHLSDEEKKSPLLFQDCSHWCLPGVPDSWNEILYAELLRKLNPQKH